MAPLWRSRLHAGNLALFFLTGVLSLLIFAPLSRLIHNLGHGMFASITSCSWIGLHVPVYDHGLALLNYPSMSYGATFASLWYWTGGFLFTAATLVVLFSFPFSQTFFSQLLPRLACLHLLTFGAVLPVVETLETHDIYMISDILHLPVPAVAAVLLFASSVGFVVFLHLVIRVPSGSLSMGGVHRILFVTVIWTFPMALFCASGVFFFNFHGLPLICTCVIGVAPIVISPFLPSSYDIFPRPRWAATLSVLFLISVLLNGAYLWVARTPASEARALLWSKPSLTHNMPLSLLVRRLYP